MVSSLDGFIAKKDNSVSWFETPDHYEDGITEENVEAFMQTIDCFVMGSRTYELALELSKNYGWAYGDTPTIVLSHRKLPVERNNIELYAGNLHKLVEENLKPRYNNVWMVGGAELAADFMRLKLADEIRMSVIPIVLGEGLSFFKGTVPEQALHLKKVSAYKNGIVEMCYEIKKEAAL